MIALTKSGIPTPVLADTLIISSLVKPKVSYNSFSTLGISALGRSIYLLRGLFLNYFQGLSKHLLVFVLQFLE